MNLSPSARRPDRPELLAPAGNWECARAAVANGADAVYFGLPRFNARLRADNFTLEELPALVAFLHARKVRAYVTLNTLVFPSELADAEEFLLLLQTAGVDAIIVQDLGLVELARAVAPDVEVHASTQMTITSPEGARFAAAQGVTRVVLAREVSLREMARFSQPDLPPLEVFVHGALCVAYSGQCLTSESLGQRSANRGECAQACRLPYQLIVDGAVRDLGDRAYLLSPQDLAAAAEIPNLIGLGVASFKIEGRLKAPEYVAAVCQVYRKAIDAALAEQKTSSTAPDAEDRYKLEMTFSRGLFSGWMHGVNHQRLVHGRYSNKRGPLVGTISRVADDHVELDPGASDHSLRAGDGVLFDSGGDQNRQQGGRLWEVKGGSGKKGGKDERLALYFERGRVDFARLHRGDAVYQTDDPRLDAALRKSFEHEPPPARQPVSFVVEGAAGAPLRLTATAGGAIVSASSQLPLEAARKQPLTSERLRDQLGRLGETPFVLEGLENRLVGEVMVPVSELNRLRREVTAQLAEKAGATEVPRLPGVPALDRLLPSLSKSEKSERGEPVLSVLCRTPEQIDALLAAGCRRLYVDFEDIRRYKEAVAAVRAVPGAEVYLATPRIQKAGEQGFFKLIENAALTGNVSSEDGRVGVLIRNLGALDYFRNSPLKKLGDFSLNVANPLTAQILMRPEWGLERITVSYDLNARQVGDLLDAAPPEWFELVLHQHMPMFHMEHCVFAAFLSEGTDHTNCGRPCDTHRVALKDRVGVAHPVMADVGCRNTVYHGRAQSGAAFHADFVARGARHFRLELLREEPEAAAEAYRTYRALLAGTVAPEALLSRLQAASQLGVTSGTLTVLAGGR